MNQLKQNIHQQIFGYRYNEFLPIYIEGKTANTGEFVRYKIKKLVTTGRLI